MRPLQRCLYGALCLAAALPAWSAPGGPSLMADTGGAIETVVLQLSEAMLNESLPTYRSYLSQIEGDTVVHIVCESAAQVALLRELLVLWEIPNRSRVKVRSAGMELTGWARDRFVIRLSDDKARRRTALLPLLPPDQEPERYNDLKVPSFIARSANEVLETRESHVRFEGGNIVSSESFAFVGYKLLVDTGISGKVPAQAFLRGEFGKDVVAVGSDAIPEPHDHVDMYLTPISDDLVVLGDPRRGERLARTDPAFVMRKNLLFLRKDLEELEAEGGNASDCFGSESKSRSWELVRTQLEDKGFDVVRVPLVEDAIGNWISYNNVVMERRGTRRILYMPVYGFPKLDVAALRIYRSLGFEVRPVDVSSVFRLGGTLRCLTNVLSRRPDDDYDNNEVTIARGVIPESFSWGR